MNNKKPKFIFFLFFLCTIIISALNFSIANSEIIDRYVNDNAGIFTEQQKIDLENNLINFENITNKAQIVIFTELRIPEGTTIEERTLNLAEENKIGKAKSDNGVLFYLAVEDREYRWEVGYGIEPTLNSALLGRISRDIMVPEFKNGDYANGIIKGIDAVERIMLDSYNEDILKDEANTIDDKTSSDIGYTFGIIAIIIFFIIIGALYYYGLQNSSYIPTVPMKKSDSYYTTTVTKTFESNSGFSGGSVFLGGGGSFGGGGFSGKF